MLRGAFGVTYCDSIAAISYVPTYAYEVVHYAGPVYWVGWECFHSEWAEALHWMHENEYILWREWQRCLRGRRLRVYDQFELLYMLACDMYGHMPRRRMAGLMQRIVDANLEIACDNYGHAVGFEDDFDDPFPSMRREAPRFESEPMLHPEEMMSMRRGGGRRRGEGGAESGFGMDVTTTTTMTTTSSMAGYRNRAESSIGRRESQRGSSGMDRMPPQRMIDQGNPFGQQPPMGMNEDQEHRGGLTMEQERQLDALVDAYEPPNYSQRGQAEGPPMSPMAQQRMPAQYGGSQMGSRRPPPPRQGGSEERFGGRFHDLDMGPSDSASNMSRSKGKKKSSIFGRR